ncbi:MAG: hypothetical protein KIS62_01175 [Ramlibacter sp.]|nr:hypothetical protein [Ramlibacter sp.]
MGNPVIRLQDFSARVGAPAIDPVKGILAQIPGDLISTGRQQLPPANSADKAQLTRQVDLQVPGLGLVRITFELSSYRHYRQQFWYWAARHAGTAQSDDPI